MGEPGAILNGASVVTDWTFSGMSRVTCHVTPVGLCGCDHCVLGCLGCADSPLLVLLPLFSQTHIGLQLFPLLLALLQELASKWKERRGEEGRNRAGRLRGTGVRGEGRETSKDWEVSQRGKNKVSGKWCLSLFAL